MENIYLDGKGLGVIFNKPWKRVAIRILFNEEEKWTSGTLHERIQNLLDPQSISPASVSNFLKELHEHGLLEAEKREGKGSRGAGNKYWAAVGIDGVWKYQINRAIKAFVDGRGGPLMFQGSWVYPTNASDIHRLQEGE